jgi:hypothetical protein
MALLRRVDDRLMVVGGLRVHWTNDGTRADCGAPPSERASTYEHLVTCPECLIALRLDTLERRREAHRVAVARARRAERGLE